MSENRNGKERRNREEGKYEGFECGVCLELMSWEKEVRMLPSCGHSFCFSCLNKLFQYPSSPSSSSSSISSSSSPSSSPSPSSSSSSPSPSSSSPSFSCCFRSVKCPICREVSQCESAESLEMNFLIPEMISVLLSSNILSSSSSVQEKSKCVNFEVCGNQTQMFCLRCDMFICDLCDSSHTSTIFSRNHKRKQRNNINSLNERGLENLRKRECPKHPSELICGYCLECRVFVCFRCVLDPHVHHKEKVKNLEESALKKRDEVVEIGAGLEKRLEVIEGRRKNVEEEMKELEEKLEKKKIEMKEIELEKEDLRIRKDSIVRLSNAPSDVSLFDDQLFSTLLQTANEIVSEVGLLPKNSNPTKGAVCCDGESFRFVSSFHLKNEPKGMSVNSDGNIFVCEYGSVGGLEVRDKEGNVIRSIERTINSLGLNPVDVSIGLNDEIVVLDWSPSPHTFCGERYRVVLLTKEGEWIKSFGSQGFQDGQFHRPFGVVVDKEGRIIVSDTGNNRIQVFMNDGSFIRSFNGTMACQLAEPKGVAVDGDGNVVVCDWGNDRIEVMDIEGNFIRRFGTNGFCDSQLDCPRSVDVDGEGRIIVTEEGNERVSVFEKDGSFLFSFGKIHMKKPRGVVVDSLGTIFVSDSEKKSIEIWK